MERKLESIQQKGGMVFEKARGILDTNGARLINLSVSRKGYPRERLKKDNVIELGG